MLTLANPTTVLSFIAIFAAINTSAASASYGAAGTLVLPRSDRFRPATVRGGSLIRDWPTLLQPFDGATRIIGLAPVKDHGLAGATYVTPMIGGGVTSTIMELAVYPAIFFVWRSRRLRAGI